MPGPVLPVAIGAGIGALGGAFGGTNTEPVGPTTPQLSGPAINLLQGIFGPGASSGGQNLQQNIGRQFGFNVRGPTAGNQQLRGLGGLISNSFRNFLSQPTAQERTFNSALPQLLGLGTGDVLGQTEQAFRPIFERNVAAIQEQGGRFSTGNLQQRTTASQDFNAFLQQAAEQGRARQIQALATLGGLGQGADISRLSGLGQFGQFVQGQQGLNLQGQGQQNQIQAQLLSQLFGPLFGGGLNQGFTQSPGFLSNLAGGALSGAGVGIGLADLFGGGTTA